MKKIMKNIAAATFAVAALAAPFAKQASGGDIFEIRPVAENGAAISNPTEPLNGGDVARFAVRLAKPLGGSEDPMFRLYPVGIYAGMPELAMVLDPPAIGIFVNGEFTLAYLESVKARNTIFTDLIFTYTVKPGDFAMPIRLAGSDKKLVTDTAPDGYYLNFLDSSLGVASWRVDDSTATVPATRTASFVYGMPSYHPMAPESDGRRLDYDLSLCDFNVKTVDFDANDESTTYWRTFHEHATESQPVGAIPSLVVSGMPATNAATLYVWSENEDAVVLVAGRDVSKVTTRSVHVTSDTTESRQVAEIKVVAGKQEYEFSVRGVAQGKDATIVMSAFPDFNYYDGSTDKLADYLTRKVRCVEPMPASVSIKPGKSTVTATSDYATYVTELNVALSENPIGDDFEVDIVPEFTDTSCPNNWWDYFRLAATTDADPTLTTPTANPKLVFKVGDTKPSSLDGVPLDNGKIYLYALRSDEYVTGAKKISFKVTTTNTDALKPSSSGGIDGWNTPQSSLTVNAQNPVVESMFDGTDKAAAVAGAGRTLQIVVSDVYADMQSDAGYEIWIEKNTDVDTEFTKIDGTYKPGKGNVLYKVGTTDTLPTVTYNEPGDVSSTLYVVSPVSRNQSANHNFTVTVSTPAGYTVTTTDDVYDYNEGDALQLKITLDKQNTLGDIYAYIKGETDADTAAINCTWKAVAGGKGRKLANYATSLSSGCTLVMLDGNASKLGSTYSYEVVFLTQDTWTDDPDKRVTAFQEKNTLVLTTHNVIPKINTVTMGLYDIGESGATVGGETNPAKFPVGISQTFTLDVDEPGEIDKDPVDPGDRKFQVRWKFSDENGATYEPTWPATVSPDSGIVEGNPDDMEYKFDFPSAGKWTVTVDMRDKDMNAQWGDGVEKQKFVFYVYVIDQPTINVTASASYGEQTCIDLGGDAKIDVDLELNNCTFDMWVNLKIELNKAGGKGEMLLQESDDVVKQADGSYNVKFGPHTTHQEIFVQTMDGTAESRTMGFKIVPTMVEDTVHIVPNSGGKHPHEYYIGVPVPRVLVYNDPPLVNPDLDLTPAPESTNECSIGVAGTPVTWSFNDVAADFAGGITVEVSGGGKQSWTVTSPDDAAGSYSPTFDSPGVYTVVLKIADKDKGEVSFRWFYNVAYARPLHILAHGPSIGNGTANSKRYRTAAGIGEGRVWAPVGGSTAYDNDDPYQILLFEKYYRFDKDQSNQKVFAVGYKVGESDQAIDPNGNKATSAATAKYSYGDAEFDSFRYTWLALTRSNENGTLVDGIMGSAPDPEYPAAAYSGTLAGLVDPHSPTGAQSGNGAGVLIYDDTLLEAIFSKEYLPSDNCGDINGDSIPDVCVDKYGFGVMDTATGLLVGDDLSKLGDFNDDEDYLPALETSAFGVLIPGLADTWATVGAKFSAKQEIRGYGPSLNDAMCNNEYTGINGIRSDLVYTDPRIDSKSTLDGYDGLMPVEYLAWLDFAAAKGLDPDDPDSWTNEFGKAVWSPERPTDPNEIDTDGDKFPDGYEYFIWYRAHVGYKDGNVHRYLTGRAYDPRNPGDGRFITSEEIAATFDPAKANSEFSESMDTDNDGLPDLIEFAIGTNPIDFDTDGDGLPDGYEIMLLGTDPLLAFTTTGVCDAMRNYDGDAMAYTTPKYERESMLPMPKHVKSLWKFALVDAAGDTDGVQWYVMPSDVTDKFAYSDDATGYLVKTVDGTFVTLGKPAVVANAGAVSLAADLSPDTTWTVGTFPDADGVDQLVRLMPTRLVAGTVLSEDPGLSAATNFGYVVVNEDIKGSMTAWPYGRSIVTTNDFGNLALGRYKDVKAGSKVAALPEVDDTVAYLHHLVYQEFGFDPRTAWNYNSPLHARWDGNVKRNFPYVGLPARTREYTLYDEFLVMSFFLNNGASMNVSPSNSNPWYLIWALYTTYGRGPSEDPDGNPTGEADLVTEGDNYRGREQVRWSPGENGADTDGDGVPDGWELYVMAGPKTSGGKFTFPWPYDDEGGFSSHGPFMPRATESVHTDKEEDQLNEYQEFAGTDTTLYYASIYGGASTITRPDGHKKWLNKFFPTDPWNADTDGDGLTDSEESAGLWETFGVISGGFIYGEPADNGKLVTIPGGGLNPLSVDTDFDGLPDPWERQYHGTVVYSYNGTLASLQPTRAKVDGVEVGNPLEGLVNGMDGTVPDAYSVVNGSSEEFLTLGIDSDSDNGFDGGSWIRQRADGSREFGYVNRDYDRDGLENWQEYMVGTMRCWRYDDPLTPLDAIPDEAYWDENGEFAPDYSALGIDTSASDGGEGEFWYKTLVDKTSEIYNPRLLTGQTTGAMYFSRVTNGWDLVYLDDLYDEKFKRTKSGAGGTYYYFPDRVNETSLFDIWTFPYVEKTDKSGKYGRFLTKPYKYVSCSPTEADTDGDGMDDYYELFHGMNPLLGGVSFKGSILPGADSLVDVVYDAWRLDDSDPVFESWRSDDPASANYWTYKVFAEKDYYKTGAAPRGTGYDFEYFPWLNGLATADPDGDDVRNQSEAIMPKMASKTWMHTDPTPLWMTDTSYARSLTRMFYRMPGRDRAVPTPGDSFTYKGVTYEFRDFGGWWEGGYFLPCQQDLFWYLYGAGGMNWMFSFEENEGYDSDHNGMSDSDEAEGRLRTASDPQDANSPNRRQAMYFQGPGRPSALQLPPEVAENYPVAVQQWPDEMTFMNFTVEAWVKAESLEDSTVVERAIWSDESKAGDEEFVRKNFQLGIKGGKWYAKYDSNGTLAKSVVEIISTADADTEKWHHLAATFNGERFILYVDGEEAATPVESSRQPEYGTSALVVHRNKGFTLTPGDYWYDVEYALRTIVVGASLKTAAEGGAAAAFDVHNGAGWSYYNRFFTGYIDEIRIWDGARLAADIREDFRSLARYTRETAIANRSAFYKDWTTKGGTGARCNRYMKDSNGDPISMVPELCYHFSFDSVPGGVDEGIVANAPAGFLYYQPEALGNSERGAAVLSRPADWNVAWWKKVVEGDGSAAAPGYGSLYSSDQWVQWVPNTVAHLPRFDGTTLDSFFWSEDMCGGDGGTYYFARTAEPFSRWRQMLYSGVFTTPSAYATTAARHHLLFENNKAELERIKASGGSSNEIVRASVLVLNEFDFTGRHALQDGLDLLPLGGAYAKTCTEMWDGNGVSASWEVTSDDANYNGLPDTWEEFAVLNYSPESEPVGWSTIVHWKADLGSSSPALRITAGEAYRRDLAHGRVVATNQDGDLDVVDRADLRQTADEDFSCTPDWWDDLYGVYGLGGKTDVDNDGLNNYVEYLVSEIFPFGIVLNPKMPKSDTETLDYFRKVGKLYLGEMFTDHDQMEDHWERSADSDSIDDNVWDAQRDGDEDGWSNFAENRYNGWGRSTLAQLISHTVGDTSTLDMPEPAIKLTARYNGRRDLTKADSGSSGGGSGGGSSGGSKNAVPTLHVVTYTDPGMTKADAEFVVRPGEEVSGEFYMGGWEDRVIRGTLQPGYISYGDVDILHAQLQQDDMYSWVDANGQFHLSRPYSEFKAALEKDPNIIQNVTSFNWAHLRPASAYGATAEKAVTVTSGGYIAVYGERVGKIDLQTGDFEFDMAAMANLSFDGFYEGAVQNAWGVKEAIFKLTYKAKVPNTELYKVTASLATPESGFVRGGKTAIMAYWDIGGDGAYTPGTDPFGVVRDVEVGWCSCNVEVELSDTSAITPRMNLWEAAGSDRVARFKESPATNRFVAVDPVALPNNVRVRVVRQVVDDQPIWNVSTAAEVIFDKTFEKDVRDFIHEGDFFADGKFDIDWDNLKREVCDNVVVRLAGLDVTNMTYIIVVGDGDIEYYSDIDTDRTVYAHPYTITRRFERRRTVPTAIPLNGDSACRVAQPTFRWKIENEEPWASAFGTTYTAFKVKVWNQSGAEVYDSGYQRMPAADSTGAYSWTAPLYVDCPSPSGNHLVFHNFTNYTWKVYAYNAKFTDDGTGSVAETFRMNVTEMDTGSYSTGIDVCYAGPAANLVNRIHVQAFETPDFTGVPVAEAVTSASSGTVILAGLREGTYFLRAYIDTDYDWTLDDWESWGYLSERDYASVTGTKSIFNPVSVTVGPGIRGETPRTIYIEDRDTDGDGFPDAWEAEQNGNAFDRRAIGPVTGDAEFMAVNTNLNAVLNSADTMDALKRNQLMQMFLLGSGGKYGVSLLTGVSASALKYSAGALRVASAVVEDTLAITSLEIDRTAGEVVLGVGAETEAEESIDPVVAVLYSISCDAMVTVKVYRTETLAAEWELVATIPNVSLSSAGTEVHVKLPDGLDTSSGFFKVEIE